jgi:hypothetical protein
MAVTLYWTAGRVRSGAHVQQNARWATSSSRVHACSVVRERPQHDFAWLTWSLGSVSA